MGGIVALLSAISPYSSKGKRGDSYQSQTSLFMSPHPLWYHSFMFPDNMFQVKVINVPPNKKSW